MKILSLATIAFFVAFSAGCESPTSPDFGTAPAAASETEISAAKNGKSHGKVTGDVALNFAGTATAKFNVHDNAPGAKADRGTVYHVRADGGTRTIDIDCVTIGDNWSIFTGETVEGFGIGNRVVIKVEDHGEPGVNRDKIAFVNPERTRATHSCTQFPSLLGNIRGGNLQVH